jgi:hypothetical protein
MTTGPDILVTYDPNNPNVTPDDRCVMLMLDVGLLDDHVRPDDWFWSRVQPPLTVPEVLVWRDGRTMVVADMRCEPFLTCDAHYHSGSRMKYGSWQAKALRDAGYSLVLCDGGTC